MKLILQKNAKFFIAILMRLIELLERQTGYLIFICSNRVSFYMVQCAIFAKLFFNLVEY